MTIPVCFGCGGSALGGLTICGRYLCPHCEKALVRSNADHPDYDRWVTSFRRFWEDISAPSDKNK